jgi:hypothetical protein
VRKFTWAAIALVGLVGSANAGKLSYSYAEGGFGVVDVDSIDSGDGYFLGGSLGIGETWLAFAEYDMASFDESGVSADVDDFSIGFGAHFPMTDKVDFVGKLAYVDESVSIDTPIGNADASDSGYKLSAGIRGQAMERLEFAGALEYVDFGDGGDDTGFALAGQYAFTDMFSLGARTRFTDDVTEYGIYARFTF